MAITLFLEKGLPVDGIEDSSYYFFHFDEAAQARAIEWFKELELQIDSIAAPAFKSHIAKFRGLMPRIALTFFLIEASAGSITEQQIPLEAVEFAIEWCQLTLKLMPRSYGPQVLTPQWAHQPSWPRKCSAGR